MLRIYGLGPSLARWGPSPNGIASRCLGSTERTTMSRPVYMDHHSTTPVDPRVLEKMLPWFTEKFGNAASRSHALGWEAEKAVEAARAEVAALIGASPREIVFTSGATESDNLAIKGAYEAQRSKKHVVTCQTEHKAVLDSCQHLGRQGVDVTYLTVGDDGGVDLEELRRAIRGDTLLVSIMLANNEVGTVHPVAEIGAIAREHRVLFHCDAAQGLSTMALDVEAMKVDLASLSAHKIYGPKGIGALYVRRRPRVPLIAQIDGGGHERGMRSGTLNVPAIVGFGEAARIAREERERDAAHVAALRARLWSKLSEAGGIALNGPPFEARHPGNLNVSFAYVESEALMLALKDIVCVSSGSACTSASLEPSYVLRAMGIDEDRAHASIRFGLGRTNTEAEVDAVGARVVEEVRRLRELSPVWQLEQSGVDPKSIDW
jgi:cysteine desulfurase